MHLTRRIAQRYLIEREAGTLQPIPKFFETAWDLFEGWECAAVQRELPDLISQLEGRWKSYLATNKAMATLDADLTKLMKDSKKDPDAVIEILSDYMPRMGYGYLRIGTMVVPYSNKRTFSITFRWDDHKHRNEPRPYDKADVLKYVGSTVNDYVNDGANAASARKLYRFAQGKAAQGSAKTNAFGGAGISRSVTVDYTGWPYIPRLARKFGLTEDAVVSALERAMPEVELAFHKFSTPQGSWHPTEDRLSLGFNYSLNFADRELHDYLKTFQVHLADQYSVVMHESIHAAQTALQRVTGELMAGVPKKETLLEHSTNGLPLSMVDSTGAPVVPIDSSLQLEHTLRDVEHQTRLNDEVMMFKVWAKKIPASMRRDLYNWWVLGAPFWTPKLEASIAKAQLKHPNVGQSMWQLGPPSGREFFMDMKRVRPERYKKTIAEFYKLVM